MHKAHADSTGRLSKTCNVNQMLLASSYVIFFVSYAEVHVELFVLTDYKFAYPK